MTKPPPADKFEGFPVLGDEKPGKQVMSDIATAASKAQVFPRCQISFNTDNVLNLVDNFNRRLQEGSEGANWEVQIKFLADPSGENTQEPTKVIKNTNSAECPDC